jgi:hypothetical protein
VVIMVHLNCLALIGTSNFEANIRHVSLEYFLEGRASSDHSHQTRISLFLHSLRASGHLMKCLL